MSASLVGSEMCIRDRRRPFARAPSGRGTSQRPPATVVAERDRDLKRSPVSYTHLTLPTICSV
eukprot:96717-Alexandrium_andersonii.AAC.1